MCFSMKQYPAVCNDVACDVNIDEELARVDGLLDFSEEVRHLSATLHDRQRGTTRRFGVMVRNAFPPFPNPKLNRIELKAARHGHVTDLISPVSVCCLALHIYIYIARCLLIYTSQSLSLFSVH